MRDNISLKIQQLTEELTEQSINGQSYLLQHNNLIPSTKRLNDIVQRLREILFPGFFEENRVHKETLSYHLGVSLEWVTCNLKSEIYRGLCFNKKREYVECERDRYEQQADHIILEFISALPDLKRILGKDVTATYNGDPAAKSEGEIIYCYPTVKALINYRIAHKLLELGVPLIPRIISEMAHSETGIDIHPGATIGEGFVIDHGTGVVIGETAIIGKDVKIYQGVTLGAKSFPVDDEGKPIKGIIRHPIIEDNVIIYAHATILGRITIGDGSIIGGNVSVTKSIPPSSRMLQK